MTVVLVTHESDIAAWARRKIVFRDGHIVEDVRQHSAGVRRSQFAGETWSLTPIRGAAGPPRREGPDRRAAMK
jgi:energy-coupling factor transporter ATP-binding protein EcfA2